MWTRRLRGGRAKHAAGTPFLGPQFTLGHLTPWTTGFCDHSGPMQGSTSLAHVVAGRTHDERGHRPAPSSPSTTRGGSNQTSRCTGSITLDHRLT